MNAKNSVKPRFSMDGVTLNANGNNAALAMRALDDAAMRELGFTDRMPGRWYLCRPVSADGDVTLNVVIGRTGGDWRIDVLDERFGQCYDYQTFLGDAPPSALGRGRGLAVGADVRGRVRAGAGHAARTLRLDGGGHGPGGRCAGPAPCGLLAASPRADGRRPRHLTTAGAVPHADPATGRAFFVAGAYARPEFLRLAGMGAGRLYAVFVCSFRTNEAI